MGVLADGVSGEDNECAWRIVASFVLQSAREFHAANPWFDNRKLAAYENVKALARPPRVLYVFDEQNLSSVGDLRIPQNFALKGDTGHSGRSVWLFRRVAPDHWKDVLRGSVHRAEEIRSIVGAAVRSTRGKRVFLEELLGVDRELPPDYKFYVVDGRCVMVLVISRSREQIDVRLLDARFKRIDLARAFDAADAVEVDIFPLAPHEALRAGEATAEALARQHGARFCRYDFLWHRDSLVFGEISPFCGALAYWQPTQVLMDLIVPPAFRHTNSEPIDRIRGEAHALAQKWMAAGPAPNITLREAYGEFLLATDAPPPEIPIRVFATMAAGLGITWRSEPA